MYNMTVQIWTWIQAHRWITLGVVVFVVLSSAGGTAWAVFFRTVASPVSLRDAIRLYRSGQKGQAGGQGLVAPGVYTYDTTGGESLSLLGVHRSFPASTSMVVTTAANGCSTVNWVPITQHTEATTVCPAQRASWAVSTLSTFEQIGGTTTTAVIECPATAYLVPPIAATGVRWSATCHEVSPAQNVAVTGLVVGGGARDGGGPTVHAVHVWVTYWFDGVDQGAAIADFWISTTRGLVVRETEQVAVTQAGVHYAEHMDTRLTSLTPATASTGD
jgi:hypothetical protein